MKRIIYIFTVLIVFGSCKKEINQTSIDYLTRVKSSLKDSLASMDFQNLDFPNARQMRVDSIGFILLRIPLNINDGKNNFVILQTDEHGNIRRGKLVEIEGAEVDVVKTKTPSKTFDGSITISSLNRTKTIHSPIVNGYFTAFHNKIDTRTVSMAAPDLPEIIVVAYVSNGISYSDWILLQSYFYESGDFGSTGGIVVTGTTGGGYYGQVTGGSGSGSYGAGSNGVSIGPVMSIDIETSVSLPAIDIQKYMNCFTNIPDAGATCSIEILTDIPVDGDPSKFFNWQTGSPGHTFIKLRKQNGDDGVQQVFGWYPASGWSTIPSPAPVPGKFVDNTYHEFNASYTVSITPDQLQSAITHVLYLARFIKYDIDEYNCTDFALEVFNNVMSPQNQLTIPMYDIPGGESPIGTSTPNGLFLKLQQMKKTGGPNASNIEMPGIKGWVGPSNGPCN